MASVAKETGILTIGIMIMQSRFGGFLPHAAATSELAWLKESPSSMIVLDNEMQDRLIEADYSASVSRKLVNDVIGSLITDICRMVSIDTESPADIEDLRIILTHTGFMSIGVGRASGPDRAKKAVEGALRSALATGKDPLAAEGVLVLFKTAESADSWKELRHAWMSIRPVFAPDAHVIKATVYEVTDEFEVTLIFNNG